MKQLESLRSNQAIQGIRAEGRVFEGELLRFSYLCHRSPPGPPRIAFIVNKRHGKAVHRNLIKRRMREAHRQEIRVRGEELIGVALSAVVIYRGSRKGAEPTFAGIRMDVSRFFDAVQSLPESKT